jgi:hypothetical protein
MEMERMMEQLLAKIDVIIDSNTKAMQERLERRIGSLFSIMKSDRKTNRDEMKQETRAGQEHMQEMIRANHEKTEAAIHSMRLELEETIRYRIENVMTRVNQETQSLQKELTEKIDKRQVELQAVDVSLDAHQGSSRKT